MSKYIGATVVNLSVDTVDVTGDITATDATPEVIIVNDTHEDTDGGREGKVTFKGQQSGGEETTLAEIQASHDGTSDDEKGDLIFKTNDGSDGASPTERLRIDSDGQTTITREDNGTQLQLKSTDADANIGPTLDLYRNSSSPADGDNAGRIQFNSRNDNSQDVTYSEMYITTPDVSDGAEDGQLHIDTIIAGTSRSRLKLMPTETVFNENSVDLDFRVESASATHAFFIEGDGNNSANDVAIGINISTPEQIGITGDGPIIHISGDDSQIRMDNNIIHSDNSGNTALYIRTNYGATNAGAQLALQGGLVTFHSGTSFTERMRINSSGYLGLGRNDPVQMLDVYNGTNNQWTQRLRHDGFGGTNYFLQFDHGGGVIGSVTGNGSNVAYNTSSDYRLKENIVDLDGATARLKQLQPRRFNFIDNDSLGTIDGFIAHEAQTVVPEAVTGTKDAMTEEVLYVDGDEIPEGKKVGDVKTASTISPQGIDQSKLVPLLTAALQEAIAKIETLETKVTALEGE